MKVFSRKLPLLVMFAVLATIFARADLILTQNNDPQPGEHNFLFYTTNNLNVNPAAKSQFAAIGTTTKYASDGKAIAIPLGGNSSLMIFSLSLTGGRSYDNLIFNPGNSLSTITVHAAGDGLMHSYVMGRGWNFLTLHASDGQPITMDVTSLGDPDDQDDPPPATPEPASLLMLGSGLAALVWQRRRK